MNHINDFEKYIASESSKNTVVAYCTDVKQFLDYVGKEDVDVRLSDVASWKTSIKNISTASQSRKISSVKKYFNFLKAEGVIALNPTETVKSVKVENEEKKALTPAQIRSMISVACPKDKAIITTLAYTAMRINELADVKMSDYLNNKHCLVIYGKGNKKANIYLAEEVIAAIDEYLKFREEKSEYLFCTANGNKIDVSNNIKMLHKVARDAGIVDYEWITNHTFRRSRATNMALSGVDVPTIQKVLRHANYETTLRYIKIDNNIVENAMTMGI